MFCGTASFKHVNEDRRAPPSSPAKVKKASKNPYSTRGLDEYSTLVAELDARKAKIMEEVRPQDDHQSPTPMVWFEYSNTGELTPVVVSLRDDQHKLEDEKRRPTPSDKPSPPAEKRYSEAAGKEASPPPLPPEAAGSVVAVAKKWRPSYSWCLVMVLVLVCLVMFGRVFAIFCTSIWWYLVPLMEDSEHQRSLRIRVFNRRKKKDYRRRLSDHNTS